MPESMTSLTEKGLAKIVVDMCEDIVVQDVKSQKAVNELKEMNENTPQVGFFQVHFYS